MQNAKSMGWCAAVSLVLSGAWPPPAHAGPNEVRKYRLYDVGTLGGTASVIYTFDDVNFTPGPFNSRGKLAVTVLTAQGYASAAAWSDGVLRALRTCRTPTSGEAAATPLASVNKAW